jgi:hypothetical protein
MNKHTIRKSLLIFAALLVVLACEVPLLAAPAASNPDPAPGSVETIVVATAGAAQTQTAIAMPSPTITSTSTPLPTFTPTETLTATPTVIFILPTATKPFVTQSAGSNCQAVAQKPVNDTVFDSREKFTTVWTLKNTGDEYWNDTDVDFRHSGGTDMHGSDAFDLPATVAPGNEVTFTVKMTAPKKPGSYTSTWTLGAKKNSLCKVSVTIIVK